MSAGLQTGDSQTGNDSRVEGLVLNNPSLADVVYLPGRTQYLTSIIGTSDGRSGSSGERCIQRERFVLLFHKDNFGIPFYRHTNGG